MFSLSILIGTIYFLVMLILHIFIWRIKKPENEMIFLLSFFILFPILLAILIFLTGLIDKNILFASFLLYFALSCAYIQTYPAARANAPSLQIIYFIHKSGKQGLSEEEIINKFNLDILVHERIKDLLTEGFALLKDDKILITNKGNIFAGIFYFYRRLYGLEQGKG
jgi:hypothetical protein